MTVEQFVASRGEPWQRLSTLCDRMQAAGPQALQAAELAEFGRLYRRTASDLAYASAHLPQLELLDYLNRLVVRAHGQLYTPPRRGLGGILPFLTHYPRRWRAARGYLAVAAALLFGALLLAWVTVAREPRLAPLFVPIELSANLQTDGQAIPTGAFVAVSSFVLTNNLTAALLAFATGVFFGLGSVWSLLKNGLLIGGIAGLAQSAGGDSLLAYLALLLPHGVVELAALVTCGAAGLMLGHSLIAGGEVTRARALQTAGRDAFALLLGCLPWFVLAALIEGLLTPLAAPLGLKLAFGGLTGGLLAWYLAS